MYKIFIALMLIVWLYDVFDINLIINGVESAQFLDITCPINGWMWFLFWFFVPATSQITN